MSKPGALIAFFLVWFPLSLTGLAQTPNSTTEPDTLAKKRSGKGETHGVALRDNRLASEED